MKDYYYKEESEYIGVLNECFATDKALIEKWHISAPSDVDTCVRKTYYDLKNAPSLKFFVLYCDEPQEVIGFFGSEHVDGITFMTSFFIKPAFRNETVMDFFWQSVEKETGMDYYTSVYAHNTRAQRFLEKKGFTLIDIMNVGEKSNAIIYKNN